ncbi:MAG TPA: NeuD/PglB/VioB family sugar acetyltransferase [Rhizomicrobium sp.]
MKLALIGGGGHCRSCIDVARSAGLPLGGIVDPADRAKILDLPRLGDDAWLDMPEARAFQYLVTVGQIDASAVRRRLFDYVRERKLDCATVIAASAIVSTEAALGAGTIVMHRAFINAGATVGANCIVNTGAIVEHDVWIGDHCHVSTGAIVNGGATIGEGCMIGSGAIVLQGVTVAAGAVVGAGAVVAKNIEKAGTWIGVPARKTT